MKVACASVVGTTLLLLLLPAEQGSRAATPAAGTPAASTPAAVGTITVVQAVPEHTVEVRVDGRSVGVPVGVGELVGPLRLPAGSHEVTFRDASGAVEVTSTLEVEAGSTSDVVLHRPAEVGGEPVVSSYGTPTDPIGPGKARVLVAHTATVAPADVRVNGQTVFTNIANGEFATADVPAGTHEVELLPTGSSSEPILGPIDLTVAAGTVSMVYAVGSPRDGSMDVILHSARLTADGSVVPDTIRTGSAGLVATARVRTFGP